VYNTRENPENLLQICKVSWRLSDTVRLLLQCLLCRSNF